MEKEEKSALIEISALVNTTCLMTTLLPMNATESDFLIGVTDRPRYCTLSTLLQGEYSGKYARLFSEELRI